MLNLKNMKERNNKFESKKNKSISLGKYKSKFQMKEKNEEKNKKEIKTNKITKIEISFNDNENNKEMNTGKNFEIETRKTKNENKHFFKKKQQSESKKVKFNTINSVKKENNKSKNLVLSKNSTKENNKNNKRQVFYPQRNKDKELSKKKENSTLANIEKILFTIEDFESISKNKETLSTNDEISSNRENKIIHSKPKTKIIKTKNNNKNENLALNRKTKNNFHKKINNNKNNDISKEDKIIRREKIILTPIPLIRRKRDGNRIQSNNNEVQNAIVLRRQEYDDFIKSLNKPKPKSKPEPIPAPKPKIYDINKLKKIQKTYKGFQTREINQTINRLKVNLCANELFCLVLNETFIHANKRIYFSLLKLYYHEPFHSIYNEIDFTDRIYIKLSDRYYNFNNFVEEFY